MWPKFHLIWLLYHKMCKRINNKTVSDPPSHTCIVIFITAQPLYACVSPLPCEWACPGECVLFQWHTDWVIYGLLSARQRLLLGKSRRGATTSLFSPDPMMSGLSAPSLKLGARHPSCWSGSHRDPVGCEPQLDADDAAVFIWGLGNRITYTQSLLPFIVLMQIEFRGCMWISFFFTHIV